MNPRHVAPRLIGRLELSTDLGAFLGDRRVGRHEAIERPSLSAAVVTRKSTESPGLAVGARSSAASKVSSVILAVIDTVNRMSAPGVMAK
jgi:hypothetical protein